jgi:16S rRNA (cytosine967-C5)-methyltransferase
MTVASAAPRAPRPDPHGLRPRRAALDIVSGVLDRGRTLDEAKADAGLDALAPSERARAGDLAAATLRWLGPADRLLAGLMERPVAARARVARDALRLAAVETGALGVAPHAAVDAAVRLTKADAKAAPLSGLVNAVARRAAAAAPGAFAAPGARAEALPRWLADRLARAWGAEAARAMAAAQLAEPPLDLTLRDPTGASDWAARLGAGVLPTGSLRLRRPPQITAAPGFAEGAWWAQDAAAALPARLLGAGPGTDAIDLCAAPGGKTMQLAAAGARVTAVDQSETRLGRLRRNLGRTGLAATVVRADAAAWRPPAPAPAVLLDAPCSATGTVRRHPDLPHRRGPGDVAALVALQDRLLEAAWEMVAPGGLLVFCTCSLLPEEGEARVAAFLSRRPDAARVPVTAAEAGGPAFVTADGDLRTRPDLWADRGGIDGFFAARLRRAGG